MQGVYTLVSDMSSLMLPLGQPEELSFLAFCICSASSSFAGLQTVKSLPSWVCWLSARLFWCTRKGLWACQSASGILRRVA